MAELKKFPNIRSLSWRSTKMQKWNTVAKTSGSGRVRTMTTWAYPQWIISTQFAYLSPEDYRQIMGFFASLKGGLTPFLWWDPEDHEEKGIRLGLGRDGEWQALRQWGDYLEPVAHVEDVKLYADGAPVGRVTSDKGVIRTSDSVGADAVITADYTYYWKVRLAEDRFTTEATFQDIFKSKTMKLETVR